MCDIFVKCVRKTKLSCLLIFLQIQNASSSTSPIVLVVNKIDCASSSCEWVDFLTSSFNKHVFTSAVTGQGISDLETAIVELVGLNKIPAGGRKWTVNQVSHLSRSFEHFIFAYLYTEGGFLW